MRLQKRHFGGGALALLFIIGLSQGRLAFGETNERPRRTLQERLSRWNPVGSWVKELEDSIPGLDVRGFLRQRTDLDLHGKTGSLGQGGRFNTSKRYDFPTIEWLAELMLKYKLGPEMELININNFLYDAAFDWQNDWTHQEFRDLASRIADNPQRPRTLRKLRNEFQYLNQSREYSRNADRILRELYLDWFPGNWLVRVGKQQVGWGKMIGKVIDIVNPERNYYGDFQTPDDFEANRITTWMANVTYYHKNTYFQFFWIPDYRSNDRQASIGPYVLNRLPSATTRLKTDRPSASFRNHELGFNVDTLIDRWDLSFFYFHHWKDTPVDFWREAKETREDPDDQTSRVTRRTAALIEPKPIRLHTFGTAIDVNFDAYDRNWAYRIEGNYTLNDYFRKVNRLNRPAPPSGVAKRNWVHVAQNISTKLFRGDATVQVNFLRQFGWDRSLVGLAQPTRPNRWIFVGSLSHPFAFTSDRLVGTVVHSYQTGSNDQQMRIEASYRISDFLNFKTRYWWKEGPSDGGYGYADNKDTLRWELQYNF